MLKCLSTNKFQNSGQLAVVLPVVLTLFIGGTLMWGYVNSVQSRYSNTKIGTDMSALMVNLVSRVKHLLVLPAGPGSCPNFNALKDLAPPLDPKIPPPAPSIALNFGTPPAARACSSLTNGFLLTNQEAAMLSFLSITVSRIGGASNSSLSTRVRVDISATPATNIQGSLRKTYHQSYNFLLRVAMFGYFNIVMMPNISVASPLFEIDPGGGSLNVNGFVYLADRNTRTLSPDYISATTLAGTGAPIQFEKPVLARAGQISYQAANEIDQANIQRVFKGGLETSVLTHVGTFALPFDQAASGPAWTSTDDYTYVQNAVPGQISGVNARVVDNDPATAITANTLNTSPSVIPDATRFNYSLESTCGLAAGRPFSFVYTRYNTDIVIDFTRAPLSASKIFCGMIAAKELTIRTNQAIPHAIIGNFIVSKVHISGPGAVYFYNPSDNSQPIVSLPAGQNMMNIFTQFLILAEQGGVAQNFYQPLFRDPVAANVAPTNVFLPQPQTGSVASHMVPCSNACGNGVGAHLVPAALQDPDYSVLFPGGNVIMDNLVYQVEPSL
ncbi:MAG: hypothetical protein AB7F43_08460 [Bacteriovoracia bacterium]